MVKKYIHDITPHEESSEDGEDEVQAAPSRPRSIRDFKPSAERVRLQTPRPSDMQTDYREERPRRRSRWGMWLAAALLVLILSGVSLLFLFPTTSITITPHTRVLTFDTSMPLTAYPSAEAAAGTISYTVVTQVFEDSTVVQANGTEHAEDKATGTITIYNESAKVSRLIKNTRFQSPTGLIYRIPASVDVPAAKGTTPGTATVTVFADQTGPTYNIGATDKFTLPGLKGTPEFAKIYAKSTTAFAGGFSGDRPAVSPSVLEASKAEVRGRINEKAQQFLKAVPDGSVAFAGIMAITYETQPATNEPGGGVRIHERATVTMPVFPVEQFAHSIAQAIATDAEGQRITMIFANDIAGQPLTALNAADIGTQPLTFTLNGKGELIWQVDAPALAQALAGRDEGAFQNIVKGYPAIDEARARITPFWRHSFPQDPNKIMLTVQPPASQF